MALPYVHRITTMMRRAGTESWHLAKLTVQNPGNFQQLLVNEARQSNNRTAALLLQTQREVGLVRYYGVSKYLEQKWIDNRTNGNAQAPRGEKLASSSRQKAKVSFMITTPMKEHLKEMGYTADAIKKLTPLQANIILEQKVSPDNMNELLPTLEAEHQTKMAEQAKRIKEQEKEEGEKTNLPDSIESSSQTLVGDNARPNEATHKALPSSFLSTNVLDETEKEERIWFQVIDSTSEEVLGLFSNEKEANERVGIQREIDKSGERKLTVRKVIK